ncbi:hypothetical protein [Microcoleus sp. T3_D1]|uniref:hypothetical protein n=1 Tax=Microcoleus sp. T3_D1 TaxID=3055427 RepID=UPI002FD327B9
MRQTFGLFDIPAVRHLDCSRELFDIPAVRHLDCSRELFDIPAVRQGLKPLSQS